MNNRLCQNQHICKCIWHSSSCVSHLGPNAHCPFKVHCAQKCIASAGRPAKSKSRLGRSRPASQDLPDADPELDPNAGNDPLFDPASEALPVSRPHQSALRPQGRAASSNLVKKYGALFIWGQLSGWFKQTVYDPTASLSAERRGTLSLPDPDSCYGSGRQYTVKVAQQASACDGLSVYCDRTIKNLFVISIIIWGLC